jgi:hypothetical protein
LSLSIMRAVNSLLVVAILLFATVITWTYFSVRGDQTSSPPQAGIGGGPETTNFNSQFRTLLPEHGNLAVLHLTNLYDGKDTANTSQSLEDNAQGLGDVIKQLGTAADREKFLRTFRGHIDEYEIYTTGRKENKPEAINIAKENLQMHAMDFGNLAHKLMPTISEQRGTELMNEHVTLTLAIVDAHAKGDTAKKLQLMKDANAQALRFSGELAKGAEATNK